MKARKALEFMLALEDSSEPFCFLFIVEKSTLSLKTALIDHSKTT
jgi:hypothetical protein